MNLYKLPLINTVGVSNIRNAKALNTFQIIIAWVANEQEHTYNWFLNILKETIYNTFACSPEVFISNSNQVLRKAANNIFSVAKKMKVAYSEKINKVKEAFNEIKQAVAKKPILLLIIHPHWYLKHDLVSQLSSSLLSSDLVINKALYKLENKYKNLNNCESKATLLYKIEALAIEKNI
ncbi:24617_t:CDS:2, partial [Cetraspora pellucida]